MRIINTSIAHKDWVSFMKQHTACYTANTHMVAGAVINITGSRLLQGPIWYVFCTTSIGSPLHLLGDEWINVCWIKNSSLLHQNECRILKQIVYRERNQLCIFSAKNTDRDGFILPGEDSRYTHRKRASFPWLHRVSLLTPLSRLSISVSEDCVAFGGGFSKLRFHQNHMEG